MMQTVLSPKETKIAVTSILIYLTIYSFEAPIRYGLVLLGLMEVILLRDLLILGPLGYIIARQAFERRLHPVLLVFGFLIIVQGTVFYLNFHAVGPVILGTKLLVNVVLGLLVGVSLINCSGRLQKYIAFLFFVGAAGVLIEKWVTPFPWVGMSANIGGIDVVVSLDWGGDDPLLRRVGGFTRLSINVAGLLPVLACILVPKWRTYRMRVFTLLLAIVGVSMTTQKGATVAVLLVAICLLLPTVKFRNFSLRLLALSGAAAQVILPFATAGMPMSEGTGQVFTQSSFAARVIYTWPASLRYISENALGIFGTGLGSLGSPMRVVLPAATWMFADNMFIFVYGYLGIFALVFYWAIGAAVWRSLHLPDRVTEAALAVTAFVLWYGTVITCFEDQALSLALGASLGTLLFANAATVAAPVIPRVGPRIPHAANTSV